MENNCDGSVIIAAEIDETGIREGIASLRSMLSSLAGYAHTISDDIGQAGRDAADTVPGTASLIHSSLISGLLSGRAGLASAVRSLLASAQSAASGSAGSFSSIGRNAVSGIIAGINGAAAGLWDTLRSLASRMLSTLKSALGIQSPSKLMRDTVGQNVGRGIRDGILGSLREVEEAAGAVRGAVSAGISGSESLAAAGDGMRRSARAAGGQITAQLYGSAGTAPVRTETRQTTENTFIFNKPVETPYAHAREIRCAMEELLYGT